MFTVLDTVIENYQWTIVSAPESVAEDEGKVIREVESSCTFTLEDSMSLEEAGTWEVELEVQDNAGNIATDTVTVTVVEANAE